MKLTRIALMAALFLSLFTMGACKKTVYQQVNQVYSTTYSIKTTDWTQDNSGTGVFQYYVSLSVPEIDDQIMATGGVVVYMSFDGGSTYDALPETINGVTYGAIHSKGSLTIGYTGEAGGSADAPSATYLAKVVVLDGQSLD